MKTPSLAAPAAALLLALAAGCAPRGEVLRAELVSGARPGRYIPLKFVKQEPNRCGSAVLSEVLAHWGAPRSSEAELAEEVFSKSLRASLNVDLAAAARRRGLVVRDGPSGVTELRAAIASGYPAVVMITLSPHVLKRKHFLAVKGVDSQRGYLLADDGGRADAVLRPRPFRRDWRASRFWALYCWPAGKPPSWAAPTEELAAGVILEGRGQPEAAGAAYRRALAKDAKLWEAHFNLGNLELARGKPAAAAARYRSALALRPAEPDVLNNLAWALLKTGKGLAEAEKLARRALEKSAGKSAERVRAGHTLGLVLAARGRKAEARRVLARAIKEAEAIKEAGLARAARADLEKLGKD